MLNNDFDPKLIESTMDSMGGAGANNPMSIPVLPFLQSDNPGVG